jgi:FkbM family methyltransferase
LLLDPRSLVDRSVIDHGSWELDRIEFLLSTARTMAAGRQAMFLDVGAYWGLYAMLAARSDLFDEVIAFEPDRHNFAQLQAQLFLNDLSTRVEARRTAVTSGAGRMHMMFSSSHPDGNRAGVGVISPDEYPGEYVDAVALDDVIDVTGRFVVAKIDVEGHERAVLDGMERLITRNDVLLQIEVFEPQRPAVMPRLAELGLRVVHEMYPDCFVTNA